MRARAIVAILLLLLPAGLSAQRIPMRVGRRPPRPEALPPQPPAIARELAYKRMRLSVEGYPVISYVDAPGYIGNRGTSHWTSFGTGTRADYRFTRFVSATLDMTSSFGGGPAIMNTVELGTRLHRERTESKAYPFADVRVGYMHANDSYFQSFDDAIIMTQLPRNGFRYSEGFGGVAGVGMEYALTRRFSLTTAGSVMRNRMIGYNSGSAGPSRTNYVLTAYRFTLGLRYNPVRLIRPPTDLPATKTP